MLFQVQYENRGSPVTRHIVEFDGPENDMIAALDRAVHLLATTDERFRVEGGTNADLQAAASDRSTA